MLNPRVCTYLDNLYNECTQCTPNGSLTQLPSKSTTPQCISSTCPCHCYGCIQLQPDLCLAINFGFLQGLELLHALQLFDFTQYFCPSSDFLVHLDHALNFLHIKMGHHR